MSIFGSGKKRRRRRGPSPVECLRSQLDEGPYSPKRRGKYSLDSVFVTDDDRLAATCGVENADESVNRDALEGNAGGAAILIAIFVAMVVITVAFWR